MRQLILRFTAAVCVFAASMIFPFLSASLGAQARAAADLDGVRVGDRIILNVEGEKALTDSFTVAAGPSIELPVVGIVSLVGVHRSDLEPYLTATIGRFFRNPIVRVKIRSRMRLSVLGEVNKPGFYDVPSDALLSDVITMAGGPAKESRLSKMKLERGEETLLSGDALRKALDGGASLTQLGVQSGDRLVVPAGGRFVKSLSLIGTIIAIPLSIVYLLAARSR